MFLCIAFGPGISAPACLRPGPERARRATSAPKHPTAARPMRRHGRFGHDCPFFLRFFSRVLFEGPAMRGSQGRARSFRPTPGDRTQENLFDRIYLPSGHGSGRGFTTAANGEIRLESCGLAGRQRQDGVGPKRGNRGFRYSAQRTAGPGAGCRFSYQTLEATGKKRLGKRYSFFPAPTMAPGGSVLAISPA